MKKFIKSKSLLLALTAPAVYVSANLVPYTLKAESKKVEPSFDEAIKAESREPGYTINFNEVSIIEFIKYVSKIADLNFVYSEEELNFTITIVSEEPTTLTNVMSALVQVLRARGFSLLEQGNNIVIHQGTGKEELAPVVGDGVTDNLKGIPPVVTRLYRLRNANPKTISKVITPLLSKAALLEISQGTRHLILTDSVANIEKVSSLIKAFDSTESPLEVDSYTPIHNNCAILAKILNEIITPVADDNPVILVPNDLTNTLFIVSTPSLVNKSLVLLEDLDTAPKIHRKTLSGENLYFYALKHLPVQEIQASLNLVIENLEKTESPPVNLIETIESGKYIKTSNSILFIGDKKSLETLKNILGSLDTSATGLASEFYIYKIEKSTFPEIDAGIKKLAANLSASKFPKEQLINALKSAKFIPSSRSIVFTGTADALKEIKVILPTLDIQTNHYYIYKIQSATEEQISAALEKLVKNLQEAKHPNTSLIHAISTMRWVKETNTLVFSGTNSALDDLKKILPTFDVPPEHSKKPLSNAFYIYKPEYHSGEQIVEWVHQIGKNLKNSGLSDNSFLQTLDSAKYVADTGSVIFTGDKSSLQRVKNLLPTIDTKSANSWATQQVFLYPIENTTEEHIENGLKNVAGSLPKNDPLVKAINSSHYLKESNTIVFNAGPNTITRLKELLKTLDSKKAIDNKEIYLYPIHNASEHYIRDGLDKIAATLPKNAPLAQTIYTAKFIKESRSFVFNGPVEAIDRVKTILNILDSKKTIVKDETYLYTIKNTNEKHIEEGLKNIAKTLPVDDPLAIAIKNAEYLKESNSFVFNAPPTIIGRIKELLTTLDAKGQIKQKESAYVYKIHYVTYDLLRSDLLSLADSLPKKDPLRDVITSMHYLSQSDSIVFRGTPEEIDKLKHFLALMDTSAISQGQTTVFVYKIENVSWNTLEHGLDNITKSLPESDPIVSTIESMRYLPHAHSIVFKGPLSSIDRIKSFLSILDNKDQVNKLPTQTYKIYKLKYVSGDTILKDLKNISTHIKSSGVEKKRLIQSIRSIQYIKGTNSLYITGDKQTIDEVLVLVEQFDQPRAHTTAKASEFYMYKPKYESAEKVKEALVRIASDLKESGLADPDLIQSIDSVKEVDSSKSLLFTGTPKAIEKIKTLLPSVDVPSDKPTEIKHIGQTTFLIYKIKYVSGTQLMHSLRQVISDIRKTGHPDRQLALTIENMRFIKETDSIIFTGTKETLEKAKALAAKFDVPSLARKTTAVTKPPEDYVIYKPKYLSGEELIHIIHDFEQNLVNSGVKDHDLFETINNLKWMEKTSSILIAGSQADTQKVYDLLERFDIPQGNTKKQGGIETIEDVSFLIYKLQYHQGAEIQSALQKVATDLGNLPDKSKNQNLVDAIKSIQWIQVTNSLIGSGNSSTLQKLNELIRSIDTPLRQVFIEVLVIETNVTNTLNFGLRWGSQGKYRNRIGFNTGAYPLTSGGVDPLGSFNQNLHDITASKTPTGQDIPNATGFDLGVIGDIILHKGQTYYALGSLLNALQSDSDSVIVLNQKIITQDNRQSVIFVGSNIPYTGSLVTTANGGGQTTNANLEYRDIGVSLTITPTIGNGDMVTLDINESITEDESQPGDSSTSSTQVTGITTAKSTTTTKVTMPSDTFLIVSGMIRDTTTRFRTGIPCLGSLPLIGVAFSNNDKQKSKQNIVIFVRPHIVKDFTDYKKLTERQEDIYRNQSVPEDFDEGIDLVKTPDDE